MLVTIFVCVSLVIVGMAASLIIHVCSVGRASTLTGHRRANAKSEGRTVQEGLHVREYNAKSNGKDDSCIVCQQVFKNRDECVIMPPCDHCFHARCIEIWLAEAPVCPLCRTHVISGKLQNDLELGALT